MNKMLTPGVKGILRDHWQGREVIPNIPRIQNHICAIYGHQYGETKESCPIF